MTVVLEAHRGRSQLASSFDEDLAMRVDQNVGDRVILEQGLERPQSQEFVQDVADQAALLLGAQGNLLGG